MNDSCHVYEWGVYAFVLSDESWHIWMSHGTYEWVMRQPEGMTRILTYTMTRILAYTRVAVPPRAHSKMTH